jgi:hypothetical protein
MGLISTGWLEREDIATETRCRSRSSSHTSVRREEWFVASTAVGPDRRLTAGVPTLSTGIFLTAAIGPAAQWM